MKIDMEVKHYEGVRRGEAFWYAGDLHMKCKATSEGVDWAVRIDNGELVTFNKDDEVHIAHVSVVGDR